MNVIDICPVGALTSMDFRFRARVWEMSFTDSVCPGCARGCNISIGVMDNEVLRTEPRTNPHVNQYWMCDHGRLTTPALINTERVAGPMIRRNGVLQPTSWQEATAAAVDILQNTPASKLFVLGSAMASNEDNYLLARLAHDVLKTANVDMVKHIDHGFGDDMLRVNETAPNAIGAHVVGITPGHNGHTVDQLAQRIQHGDVSTVVVLADSAEKHSVELAAALAGVDNLIVISSHMSVAAQQASVLLSMASFAETDGTFTNITHRVQRFRPAIATKENERTMGLKMSRWDKFGAPNDRWSQGERRDCRSAWRIVQDIANGLGATWAFASSKDVFTDLSHHVGSFQGMSYELLDRHMGVTLEHAHAPEPVHVVYESHMMKPQ
jgi:NADH-quinone oxidoreductase subunit G